MTHEQILRSIKVSLQHNEGKYCAFNLEELASTIAKIAEINVPSKSAVSYRLKQLIEKGLIVGDYNRGRLLTFTLRITEKGEALLHEPR